MTPQPDNSKNTFILLGVMVAMMLGYQYFVARPAELKARQAQLQQQQRAAANPAAPGVGDAPPLVVLTHDQALKADPRVPIDTPESKDRIGGVVGSINLTGGLLDDVSLRAYRQEPSDRSPLVEVFRPVRSDHAYSAETGWAGEGAAAGSTPGLETPWRVISGDKLGVGHPVVLGFESVGGLTFRRQFEVDDHFMFTVTDTVTNTGAAPVSLIPYAAIKRVGLPVEKTKATGFEGGIGFFPNDHDQYVHTNFNDLKKKTQPEHDVTGGWMGLTDKYWLGAVIPDQKTPIQANFGYTADRDLYKAWYRAPTRVLAPGATTTNVTHVFAGAKSNGVLEAYSKALGIPNFKLAIDWGWLFFLTQPLFSLLTIFYGWVGNWGWAILMLTVVVRGAMFPLALQSYASMSKMKKVQPQLEELKKKFVNDPTKIQQETMALYQREKINPVAGCLPMLLTIPIFIALNNMLTVTIELRHQPFIGWIHDLSARDPTTILNLFGLIPWDPSTLPLIGPSVLDTYLHIGVWPLLYGATTFLQMQMQPTPSTDPTQKMIMQFFPLVFMVFIGQLAVGLVIYYVWSNTITILQQWFMMRRSGVDTPIDTAIARARGRLTRISSKAAG
jgi:YidC/Oxa1 family membrane protein insertase